VFSLGNAALLFVRIRAEEAALGDRYVDAFSATPRFIPGGGP
jgi:methyltransferase